MCHSRALNIWVYKLHDVFVLFIMTKNELSKIAWQGYICCNTQSKFASPLNRNVWITKGLSPKAFANVWTSRNQANHNLHHSTCFKMPLVNSVSNGTKCIAFLDPKIWEIVPEQVKQKESFKCFQRCNKKWSPTNCPCRLCKIVLHDVGFLQQFA